MVTYPSSAITEEAMVKKESKSVRSEGKVKTPKKTYKNVEFTFYSSEATYVYVAGEFNGWDTQSLPMKKDKDGV